MYRSPHTIAYRDIAYSPAAARYGTNVEILTEAGNRLMDYQRPTTLYPRYEVANGPTRGVPMLPGRVDFHIAALQTRTKRAAKDQYTFDRRSSEKYPTPPPLKTLTFVSGAPTRLHGREDVILIP
jgi:hypothetical protein